MDFTKYTPEQLQKAREYAAKTDLNIAKTCFDDGFGFASHVTQAEKQAYSDQHKKSAQEIVNGEKDHNFTVAQRMYYYLTGESVPFLPA